MPGFTIDYNKEFARLKFTHGEEFPAAPPRIRSGLPTVSRTSSPAPQRGQLTIVFRDVRPSLVGQADGDTALRGDDGNHSSAPSRAMVSWIRDGTITAGRRPGPRPSGGRGGRWRGRFAGGTKCQRPGSLDPKLKGTPNCQGALRADPSRPESLDPARAPESAEGVGTKARRSLAEGVYPEPAEGVYPEPAEWVKGPGKGRCANGSRPNPVHSRDWMRAGSRSQCYLGYSTQSTTSPRTGSEKRILIRRRRRQRAC
jgi:hypothetical protein